jgi:hypothetical protein
MQPVKTLNQVISNNNRMMHILYPLASSSSTSSRYLTATLKSSYSLSTTVYSKKAERREEKSKVYRCKWYAWFSWRAEDRGFAVKSGEVDSLKYLGRILQGCIRSSKLLAIVLNEILAKFFLNKYALGSWDQTTWAGARCNNNNNNWI